MLSISIELVEYNLWIKCGSISIIHEILTGNFHHDIKAPQTQEQGKIIGSI